MYHLVALHENAHITLNTYLNKEDAEYAATNVFRLTSYRVDYKETC